MERTWRWKNAPAPPGGAYCPTQLEQIANCVTHVPLVPLSIFGLIRLYGKASTWSQWIAAIVYGTAVCCLFIASSAFHLCSLLAHGSSHRSVDQSANQIKSVSQSVSHSDPSVLGSSLICSRCSV
ncbi:Monocyte to macrophage differentiation factor 2 [Fasciola hepatica]|uniref:Monocyte to macrophage differentiation factor 2 n=1 Tax=Fasciola hepatica TaxID=6192 RepID=A0A4E0RLQ7_FASHE|nr:Monocyte to macrophage differentiation factor 2 [Fasciola hepatica]